jgi:predicted RNA-binding protein Jag
VFLENYLAAFATQHDAAKIIDILQKTWKKMSSHGHEVALTLPMSPEARRLVEQALAAP